MALREDFSGGPGKPIEYCVTVVASKSRNGYEATASWRFVDGDCSVSLRLENGTFSHSGFRVHHKTNHDLGRAMQEEGLQPDELDYLQECMEITCGLRKK